MTTYNYSVPFLELERRFVWVTTAEEWAELCKLTHASVAESDVPGVDGDMETHIAGGMIHELTPLDQRKLYRACKIATRAPDGRGKRELRALAVLLKHQRVVHTSLKAVNSTYLWLKQRAASQVSAFAAKHSAWLAEVAASTLLAQGANCKLDMTVLAAKCTAHKAALETFLAPHLQVLYAVRELASARHVGKVKTLTRHAADAKTDIEVAAVRQRLRAASRAVLPAWLSSVELWAGKAVVPSVEGSAKAVLSSGDFARLEQYAAGALNFAAAVAITEVMALRNPAAKLSQVDVDLEAMARGAMAVPYGAEVHVCRAFKQAFTTALAGFAGRADALADQKAELIDMPYYHECGAAEYYDRLRTLPLADLSNLGRAYKVAPPTASLGAATLGARYKKAKAPNARVAPAPDRPPLDPRLVEKCFRDEVAVALRLKDDAACTTLKAGAVAPRWWAAWLSKRQAPPFPGWSEVIDLRGAAKPVTRSDLSPATFKDSALAPDELPEHAAERQVKAEVNMLMKRFLSEDYPTQAQAKEALKRVMARVMKSDQKVENYKDPLRLFYEAALLDRMGMSWIEECVHSVAKHHPCYQVGKSPRQQQAKARSICSALPAGRAHRMFSFDVSNWSAGMEGRIQRYAGSVWAEVFDSEEAGCAYHCMEGATVYMQKHGLLSGYTSPEANFEGLDGKSMTMVHVALQSASVQRTRQVLRTPDFSAELMAFIDDGLAGFDLPASTAEASFQEFMRCAEEVYGAYSFVLHPMKCLPSDRLGMFLNEIYYAGTHVVSATKAALRVAAEPKEIHDSLPERVLTLTAGTQGAVQAGLDSTAAALYCYYLVAMELSSWERKPQDAWDHDSALTALFVVAPTAYLGLAVPSPVGFDKTARGASISEGIAAMQSAVVAFPKLRVPVLLRLRTALPVRSKAAILRNPLGAAGLSELRSNRVANALGDKLPDWTVNSVAKGVVRPLKTFDAEGYAAAMMGGSTTLSAYAIQLMYKASPLNLADSWVQKFETSGSLTAVLGPAVMAAIARSHRADAQNAIAAAL